MKTAGSTPNINYGYPVPGQQDPTGQEVMNSVFFQTSDQWDEIRRSGKFDYIVVGTGPCALAFADRVLGKDPKARILLLERGAFFLAEHFQNLPLPYVGTLGGLSETFPWRLAGDGIHNPKQSIKWQHGMVPFFGGRSIMWSAWCPRPTDEEVQGWPKETWEAAKRNYPTAEKLLNVIPADQLTGAKVAGKNVYGALQKEVYELLKADLDKGSGKKEITSATRVLPAPMAVAPPALRGELDFQKFAAPGPMLALMREQEKRVAEGKGAAHLMIATGCVVERILSENGRATALKTSRGDLAVGDAEIVLAMGSLPPTTLVLNSFPEIATAGKRFTAHFISAYVARVPRSTFPGGDKLGDLEIGANYLAGMYTHPDDANKKPADRRTGQYHIQLTAIADKHPVEHAQIAGRLMPDVVATASPEQLADSKDHVVFVCAVLGEMDYRNPKNKLVLDPGNPDPTTDVVLHLDEDELDRKTWDTMDQATRQTLDKVLGKGSKVEYWYEADDPADSGWRDAPNKDKIRVPGLVHEGSTLHIGAGSDAPVGLDYALKGVANVFVTGGGLWPRAGSWNPTLTMVALAQDLADRREKERKKRTAPKTGSFHAMLQDVSPDGGGLLDGRVPEGLEASAVPYAMS